MRAKRFSLVTELGTRGWKSRRGQIIRSYSSKLAMRGYKKLFDRLVCHAIDGFAWNADHIVPVYKGGGQCGVDNLRTLCVACHAGMLAMLFAAQVASTHASVL